jgi:TonB family protein
MDESSLLHQKTHRPWASDIVKQVRPQMPAALRAKHVSGEALCRVLLDVGSGTVRDVIITKSSGYPALDTSIVQALRQWKLRPNRWKEFEIYVGLWSDHRTSNRSNQSLEPTDGRRYAHI